MQLCDLEDMFNLNETRDRIADLIEKAKPDLITLTGDQTWSNENLISLKSLISWLDGFKIPYAPVFGNHDCGNEKDSAVLSRAACCDLYEKGKYSLFKRGPSNLGLLGNYVVNVTEDGKIVKTLYFLDSGEKDMISDEQIEWLKWNADGIRASRGGEYAESICFFHKPIPEYADAYRLYRLVIGSIEGYFGGVTDIVCGHQHGNNFTLKYEGVRLTFALKTGKLGGYYSGDDITLDGATCIEFDGDKTHIYSVF